MSDLRDPIYSIATVSAATGINAETMRTWFKKGYLAVGADDRDSPGTTVARLFSGRSVLMIGIFGALTGAGVEPNVAALASAEFAYTGDNAERAPGQLFPEGETWIVAGKKSAGVVNIRKASDWGQIWIEPYHGRNALPIVTKFRLDEFVDEIRTSPHLNLGRDPLTPPRSKAGGYVKAK